MKRIDMICMKKREKKNEMAKVYLKPEIEISIPDSAFIYARNKERKKKNDY